MLTGPRVQIDWTKLSSPGRVTTGADVEADTSAAALRLLGSQERYSDKPFMVYLTTAAEKRQKDLAVFEETTFKDERVAIATKAFSMVKGDGDKITDDHPFADLLDGKKLPRIVVFSATGERIAHAEGKVSPTKMLSLMKKGFKHDYSGNLDKTIKAFQKYLTKADTLKAKKDLLTSKEDGASKSELRKLEKELAELAETEEELNEEKDRILAFDRRATSP